MATGSEEGAGYKLNGSYCIFTCRGRIVKYMLGRYTFIAGVLILSPEVRETQGCMLGVPGGVRRRIRVGEFAKIGAVA